MKNNFFWIDHRNFVWIDHEILEKSINRLCVPTMEYNMRTNVLVRFYTCRSVTLRKTAAIIRSRTSALRCRYKSYL